MDFALLVRRRIEQAIDLNGLIDLAEGGLKDIFAIQRAALAG